jgi:predicted Zn-dependent protease
LVKPRLLLAIVSSAWLALSGCARNPATGQQQLMLVDERGEIAMGRDADVQVAARLGLVEDATVQSYVSRVGRRLAATTERPALPWSFRVVDDASVNAFALPGGFVYVTRGLLAHLNSEAELAAVLGHEMGHVTARHSASRASEAQVATLGLALGALADPRIARNLDLLEAGVGLLMLKCGRDDEREADTLGVRYVGRAAYETEASVRVLRMLGRVEQGQPQASLPEWLSTHPGSDARVRRVAQLVSRGGRDGHREYLRAIDGLVFGEDPSEGFFHGDTFVHPSMNMRLELPRGWSTRNTHTAITAVSPAGDAGLALTVAGGHSALAAAQSFAAGAGGSARPAQREGSCWLREFVQPAADRALYRGLACFTEQGTRVLRLVGYARTETFDARRRELMTVFGSVRPAGVSRTRSSPRRVQVLDVGPLRIEELAHAYPSVVTTPTLALLNGLDPEDPRAVVPEPMKRIVGP